MAIEYRLDLQTKLFEHRVRWGAGLRREGVGETERNRRTRVMQVYEGEMAAASRDAVSDEDQRTPICVHKNVPEQLVQWAFAQAEDEARMLLWAHRTRAEEATMRHLYPSEFAPNMRAWDAAYRNWLLAANPETRRLVRESRCAA